MKLQFRLRTLMIVVTLLAVPLGYVGWQAKILRERKVWVDSHPHIDDKWNLTVGIPWVRRWFGDRPYAVVAFSESPENASEECAALFPEARRVPIITEQLYWEFSCYEDLLNAMNSLGGGVRHLTGDEVKRLRNLFSDDSSVTPQANRAQQH